MAVPTFFVEADNIPQAHYRAVKKVLEEGMQIRTQYDRKDAAGEFIDPPSRDSRMVVRIANPFNQPRYPVISFCERGTYLGEILGIKDQLVLPQDRVKTELNMGGLVSKEWPYSYHQRLTAHPTGGGLVDQINEAINRLAKDSITRRAVATTRSPSVDPFLKDDQPCLGEIHLRCNEEDGVQTLNMTTYWRSRDGFKAWHDNVVGLTFWQQILAQELSDRTGKLVKVGDYFDVSTSFHVYGQDMLIKTDQNKSPAVSYVSMGEEEVISRAMTSQDAAEMEIVPQLEGLLTPDKIKEWKFDRARQYYIRGLIEDIKSGRLLA